MASSSSSSNAQGKNYDAFISFRGADVRDTFLSHLLAALKRKQIRAFVDATDLERGKRITPTLLKAIEESYVSIIIFSKNYPNSEWCLDELHKILQCMEEKKQMAVPVFYDVDPSVVQNLQQNYDLSIHKGNVDAGEIPDLKLENWREALMEISDLAGFNSADPQYKPEHKLCDKIAEDVSKKLSLLSAGYSLTYGLYDIDSRIKDVESLIEIEKNSVSMIVIWGMGGIGKSTLARKVFNKINKEFHGHSSVWDVKLKLSNKLATDDLKNHIIQELLGDKDVKITTPGEIDECIRRRLEYKKVLIVLDDVDDPMHLKSILEDSHLCFEGTLCAGSRIIVTGRDKQVFENVPMRKHRYEVKLLNNDHALQLFSWRVFRQSYPQEKYKELSEKVVEYAQGLPLALVVLSADLINKSAEIWIAKLKKIEDIPHGNILRILKTSYDGLDRDEKRIFLDIACFFKGVKVEKVERILRCFGCHSAEGINKFCDKSLISIVSKRYIDERFGDIEMHDLIQQMGQEIVVEKSREKIENQSRLWKHKDIEYVLRTDRGTANVEGIQLNMRELDGDLILSSRAFSNMSNLRFLRIFKTFSYNPGLKTVCLPDGLEFLPNSLRYLYWKYFPLSCLPSNISLDELVELDMPRSNLKELVWDKPPPNLKRICLRRSSDLIQISNLGEALKLEIIDLGYCEKLENIGSSLENLDKLIELDLNECQSLYEFPEVPCNIEHLFLMDTDLYDHELDFSGLSNLTSLPNTIGNLSCEFECLNVSECKNLKMLPKNLENLEFLEKLVAYMSGLEELPSSICNLRSLCSLDISNCENLSKLPEDLGKLESLEILNTSGSGLEELPSSICNLRSLRSLDISNCENLSKLPEDLGKLESLRSLNASGSGLKELPSSLCNLKSLESLDISNCENLSKLPEDLGKLESLDILNASGSGLKELPSSLCNLRCLHTLDISNWENLSKLPEDLEKLESLEILNVSGSGLKELPSSLWNLRYLRTLNISNCENLNKFELPRHFLDLSNSEKLKEEASSIIQQSLQESKYRSTFYSGLRFKLCIVGSKVPEWIVHRNSGSSSLSFEFDTDGHSLRPSIFCAVVVAVRDHRSKFELEASLTCKCGEHEDDSLLLDLDSNLEHMILWHGHGHGHCREATFEICEDRNRFKIKSIGVHPIGNRGDDRKRKREEEESNWDLNLNLSLSLSHSS